MDESTPEGGRVLLAVLAHPDDETFGMGGTLARYAQEGVAVHYLCATRGEVGEVEAEHMTGYQTIADLREAELRCAAGILGLASVHFLGYRDSGMPGSPDNHHPLALAAAPLEEVADRVTCYIRLLQPQVVVTFDPIGGYKHPDHIAIHNATVRAFHLAGDSSYASDLVPYQPQKLYLQGFPRKFIRYAVRLMPLFGMDPRSFGRNKDIDLLSLVEEGDYPIHARIDCSKVQDKKAAASACHSSQLASGPPRMGILSWAFRRFGRVEQYTRAYPPAEPGLRERDLFAGISTG